MAQRFNENLDRVRRLTDDMLALADDGDEARTDTSCGILYGILRDMAYRLRDLVACEREQHRRAGTWDEPAEPPG